MKKSTNLSMPMFRRIIYIHKQIAEHKYPNCKILSKELECCEMTIHRDLNILTDEFGAPIDFDWINKGYYYTSQFSIPLLETISTNEIEILTTTKNLLSTYKYFPLYDKIQNLLNTLCACGKQKEDPLLKRIAVAPVPTINVDNKLWNLILVALKENRLVQFEYPNCTWDPDLDPIRTLKPYQLLLDNGLCFLFGFLEQKKNIRLYDIRKIRNLKILPQHFTLPDNFEFENHCGGGRFGAFTRNSLQKYKIAFYEDAREQIRYGTWADDQIIEEDDENDRTIITFTSSQDMKVLDWIFENKAYAVPIEPKELVDRWKYNIKVMAETAGLL